MRREQALVAEFHRKYGHRAPEYYDPSGVRWPLRVRLVLEEAIELAQAAGIYARATMAPATGPTISFDADPAPVDTAAVADALADLSYVVLGTAVEMGLDLQEVFDAVHASNMTKEATSHTGEKVAKGASYVPPDVAGVLARQSAPAPTEFVSAKARAIAEIEREYVEDLMGRHRGNVSAMSRESGISRTAMYALMRRTGVGRFAR